MIRLLKWAATVVGGLVIAVAGAYAYVWFSAEAILNRKFRTPAQHVVASTDPKAIARGKRLASFLGCTGCHGATLQGDIFFDIPFDTRAVGANLARLAKSYSDADFARIIRHGVRPDGTGVWNMPSSGFFELSDLDTGALISYIRSLPDEDGELPKAEVRIIGRWLLVRNVYPLQPTQIPQFAERRQFDITDARQRGEYLARIACAECHEPHLKGHPDGSTPNLSIGAGYTLDEFRLLMKEGKQKNDRDIGLMGEVARGRFSHFTEDEVADLHAFLVQKALDGE
jgi:mono/diheme cytochrome c family protein